MLNLLVRKVTAKL